MNGPITENATFTQNPVQVTVQTNPAGRTFLGRWHFVYFGPNLFVAAGFKPHHCHNLPAETAAQAFAMYGRIGAVAELSRTLLLPPLTRLTQRTSRRNIT